MIATSFIKKSKISLKRNYIKASIKEQHLKVKENLLVIKKN